MAALTNRYEDDDASHLPPGMKRVGYDTDTERYTFREGDDLWLGEPGSFYGGQMQWVGRAPDADSSGRREDEDNDNDSNADESLATSPSTRHFHEHTRRALYDETREFQPQDGDGNDWGVPVVSISATGAEPPDGPSEDTSLKRRATKLKDLAVSTVDAFDVTRRWSRKGGSSSAAQQSVMFDQKKWGGSGGSEEGPKRREYREHRH